MISDPLSKVAARSVLGFAGPNELVDSGVRELSAGRDTESLRILAGLGPEEVGESRQLFERALGELGMAIPTERDAVALLSREIASQILEETVAADVGAKQIWEITLQAQDAIRTARETNVAFGPNTSHIFRDAKGHLPIDTPENRAILRNTVNLKFLVEVKSVKPGGTIARYERRLSNGRTAWVEVRNGREISNGGVN